MIGGDEPMGWDAQLPDEPVINVGYTVAHLWHKGSVGETAEWRLVPIGHVGLGTYFTGVGLGMYGEVGWNLVDALGTTAIREGLNAASTVGVGPVEGWSVSFSPVSAVIGSATICLSTARCSRTAGPSTRSLSSARALGFAVRHGVSCSASRVVLHRCVRNAGKGGRVRHPERVLVFLTSSTTLMRNF